MTLQELITDSEKRIESLTYLRDKHLNILSQQLQKLEELKKEIAITQQTLKNRNLDLESEQSNITHLKRKLNKI